MRHRERNKRNENRMDARKKNQEAKLGIKEKNEVEG